MTTTQNPTGLDFSQGIADVIRLAFNAADDTTVADVDYEATGGGWLIRHWHHGQRYDLAMCEVGQVPGLWRNDEWLGGMGRLAPGDTPLSVAMRFLLVVHGGIEATDAVCTASRRTELHADLTGSGCTCPKAPCGGAIVGRGGDCPDHDVDDAGVWHWNTACPGGAS